MKFYGKAEQAANAVLRAFQNPGSLPAALAPIFIRRRDNVPCRQWSWANQLIVALAGHSDARGFRQWQDVGRHVKKGERSVSILVPLTKRVERDNAETGQTDTFTALYGFKSAGVFGLSQTDGEPLPAADPDTERWIESLPLVDVARDWVLPGHVVWIFTTTNDGQESLFEDQIDAHPLLSRCVEIPLSRRGLAEPFAQRAREIADREGLNGKPIGDYVRLAKDCRNNLRAMLQRIEAGDLSAE
jgi:N-terminal domain of anti-restriction factor ArdC